MVDIVIGGNTYQSNASVAEADAYLLAMVSADAWADLTADEKGKALITATRVLSKFTFTDMPAATLRDATIEYAFAISQDSSLLSASSTENSIKRMKADSVELEYFRTVNGTRFPLSVHEMLLPYLDLYSASIGGSFVSDVDRCSVTNDDYGFSNGI